MSVNPFYLCRSQLQKKKSGVKKCLEICAIKGGGGRRLMAKTILNFHFDYLTTSLTFPRNCNIGGEKASLGLYVFTSLCLSASFLCACILSP